MSEIVQRVTTAIFVTIANRMANDQRCPSSEVGRAAIAAMRDPTPEMIIAGVRHENFGDMEGRWKAMIDEALK